MKYPKLELVASYDPKTGAVVRHDTPTASAYRPAAAADFLRHTLLEIEAETAAFEASYPGSRGAPSDLDGAFAQLAYARVHVAKALAFFDA